LDKPKLTLALSHYDRHVPLFDGTVEADGIDLEVLQVGQSAPLRHGADRHARMLQKGEFDICELSLSSYLMARSRAMPFTAIPVFPRRLFSQSQMWINVASGIRSPSDLIGRKVGLNTFQTTLSVLAKGDLQSEYGVPWREILWHVANEETVAFKAEDGVTIRSIPTGKKIGDMLRDGEIDALMVPHPSREVTTNPDKVQRLFSDPKAEEVSYFRKNGFFPIMHVVAFKDEVLKQHPWAAQSILDAFVKAGAVSDGYYQDPNWSRLAWGRHLFEQERRLLGPDLWPCGVKRNRANLERFMGYSYDQGLIQAKLDVDELFAASTIDS
jgi:4,5-dihydroxyphthalate decarboxylase